MKMNIIKKIILGAVMGFSLTACFKDLDRMPEQALATTSLYRDFNNYESVLAKLYGGLTLTGLQGPAGNPDVLGDDEGASSYLRGLFTLQELPTDECVNAWDGDGNLVRLNTLDWNANNEFIRLMYNRLFYQITLCNEFIFQTSDSKLAERDITGPNAVKARQFRNEAKFLRALSYWHALDLFGNVPFVSYEKEIGVSFEAPKQINKADLFEHIEKELLELEELLPPHIDYARTNQSAVRVILAKLYLNAEVYTGTAMYDKASQYADKVIKEGGYSLGADFRSLFRIDNNSNNNEFIFVLAGDGVRSQGWGGMTYLVNAAIDGDIVNRYVTGTNGGWGGNRPTEQFVDLFLDGDGVLDNGEKDSRAIFVTQRMGGGQNPTLTNRNKEVLTMGAFGLNGYPYLKFLNAHSNGVDIGSDPNGQFPDTDFPMFRLADVLLMYAECALRGHGNLNDALTYVNEIRTRAYRGDNSGNITSDELTLDFILDERARELAWECHRRTDLIRFNKFTSGDKLWAFKGGIQQGQAVSDSYKLFPIPNQELNMNPNLKQNTGYN
jgi:starch-binding outer membrane protein, SusD/RagB family